MTLNTAWNAALKLVTKTEKLTALDMEVRFMESVHEPVLGWRVGIESNDGNTWWNVFVPNKGKATLVNRKSL